MSLFFSAFLLSRNLLYLHPNSPVHLAPSKNRHMTACFSPRRIIIFAYIHICPRRRIPHTAFLAFSRNRRGPVARLLLKILLQIPRLFLKRTYSYMFLRRARPGSCFWTRSVPNFFTARRQLWTQMKEDTEWCLFHSREIGH